MAGTVIKVIHGLGELHASVGDELGLSDWIDVTQERVDRFAEVTGDHQFIHCDPERAAETPFGGTVAHGLFTLSIGPGLCFELYTIEGAAFMVNYGYNRIRFMAPLPVGSRVRLRVTLDEVTDIEGGVQMIITNVYEREGFEKPVCVAEQVLRAYFV